MVHYPVPKVKWGNYEKWFFTIKAFMPKLHIVLITREENSRLSAVHYSRRMPEGWWDSPALNPLDRYRAAEGQKERGSG